MLKLKSAVVSSGGGNTTAAMREWSKLGWHELAAFAVMRAHCCPGAPALTAPSETKACNLEAALAALAGALDDGKAMEKALREYRTAVDCLADKGHSSLFGRSGPPQGGELQYIEQLLGRVRKQRAR
jgi:serine/threonine-protein kinase